MKIDKQKPRQAMQEHLASQIMNKNVQKYYQNNYQWVDTCHSLNIIQPNLWNCVINFTLQSDTMSEHQNDFPQLCFIKKHTV